MHGTGLILSKNWKYLITCAIVNDNSFAVPDLDVGWSEVVDHINFAVNDNPGNNNPVGIPKKHSTCTLDEKGTNLGNHCELITVGTSISKTTDF